MRAVSGALQDTADAQLEVLWAGDDARAREALERLGVRVRRVRPEQCLQLVARRAPDLLVFSGPAAAQADAIVRALRANQPGSTLPVVVVSRDGSPAAAQRRAGLMTRVSAELAPSALAAEIHERLGERPALSRLRELAISSRDVDAWLRSALEAESSGFLLTSAGALALGPGGRVAPSPELLREALAEPQEGELTLKFLELPPNRLLVLRQPPAPAAVVDLAAAQVVVVHPDRQRGEELCAELCAAGALAQAVGVEPDAIARVAGSAPVLVVIAAAALQQPTTTSLWQDARLASASWLVLDESELAALAPNQILEPAAALIAGGRALRAQLAGGALVVDRIESFGAAGWLREVGRCEQPLTLLLRSSSGRSELSLAGGKIRGATFFAAEGGAPQKGQAALQASLAMPFGRVLVGPHEIVMAHEAALQAERELTPSDPSDEPAPSEIRERSSAARAIEPNTTPVPSFRPSKPAQFSTAPRPSLKPRPASELPSPPELKPSLTPLAARDDAAPRPSLKPPPASELPPQPEPEPKPEPEPEPKPKPSLTPRAARDDAAPPPAPRPSLKPRAASEHQSHAPRPSLKPPPASEHQTPPLQSPQSAAFDVVLARGLAAPAAVRPQAPSPGEAVVEPAAVRARGPHAAGALVGPPPLRTNGPPPLRTSGPPPLRTSAPPSLALTRAPPAYIERPTPEQVSVPIAPSAPNAPSVPIAPSAPIAPIASALEPAPLPEQPDAAARRSPTSYRALALGAAAVVGAALVAIVATQSVRQGAGQPALSLPTRAAADELPNETQQRPQTGAELTPVTTARTAAPSAPAPGKVRPTPIPRGSAAAELLQRAKQARDAARPKESEALLSEVLTRYPDDFGARYHMALTLVRLRRFDDAHAQLAKAIELNSESASAWLLKGDIFLQQGLRREALRAWNRCLELQAAYPSCQERLARWRMR
jgi:Flp pilus assembly protein TadD